MPEETKPFLNRCLDAAARAEVRLAGRSLPAFQVCGGTGFVLALAVALALAWRSGLAAWIVVALAACGAFTFLALAMLVKIVTGVERLVYYHHEIAVVAASALLLRALRLPVLPYLDIVVLGLGIFLGCGRIGCYMVGCCHGRPHRWGVCYTPARAGAGFTHGYVGVRLLPVQLLESGWVLAMTAGGIVVVWAGAAPGAALAWYVTAYSVGRFGFEFLRGDAERRFAAGFSEAQWTSLLLVCGIAARFHSWHIAAAACIALAMAVLSLARRSGGDRLLDPRHLLEITETVRQISAFDYFPESSVRIGRTSLGLQISASRAKEPARCVHYYAISRPGRELSEKSVLALADTIARLDSEPAGARAVVRSGHNVFHVAIPKDALP